LTLRLSSGPDEPSGSGPGQAVAVAPPKTRHVRQSEIAVCACKADRVTVRHRHGQVVAVIEIVSPGNKASRNELRAFVDKTAALIRQNIHLLVIDLFPSSKRDPQGIHKAIWDEFQEEDFTLPPDKLLTLVSYDAGPLHDDIEPLRVAYVEPVAVGDVLPAMPLFLKPGFYVPAPLEATCGETWRLFPAPLKPLLEGPPPPPPKDDWQPPLADLSGLTAAARRPQRPDGRRSPTSAA
jgi:hypothetical protein